MVWPANVFTSTENLHRPSSWRHYGILDASGEVVEEGPALLHSRKKALLIFANNPRFLNGVGDLQKTEVKHARKEARLRFSSAVGRFVQGTLCGIGGTIMPF